MFEDVSQMLACILGKNSFHFKHLVEKIFLLDQDNRIICLDINKGMKIWDFRTVETFIKSQNLLGLAISKKGNLVFLNSAGDVVKTDSNNGKIFARTSRDYWITSALWSRFLFTISGVKSDYMSCQGCI